MKKVLFVHLPKNGGTTVKEIIKKIDNPNIGVLNDFCDISHYKKICIEYNNSPKEFLIFSNMKNRNDFFSFCFVRNPWERVVSCYFWCKKNEERRRLWNNIHYPINLSFNDFVKMIPDIIEKKYTNFNSLKWHLSPQYYQIFDNKKQKIDYIGRFENFEEELKNIFSINKIKYDKNYLKFKYNSTIHDNYRNYYNEETIKIINDVYIKDIEEFNYKY